MLPAALGIAVVFLLLGFFLAWRIVQGQGGQTLTADLLDEARVRAQIEIQRQTNAALEEEIARARQALAGNVCRPEGPLSPGQVPPSLTPIPPGALPPPAPAQPGAVPPAGQPGQGGPPGQAGPPGQPPQPGQAGQPGQPQPPGVPPATVPAVPPTPFSGTLAQLLEQGVVLIVARGQQGFSMGSGFFVAPGLVMTNAHVAREGRQLLVLNRDFGRPLPAEIVANSWAQGNRGPMTPDLALLRVTGAPALQPLGLTTEAGRLQDVVSAGFPGHILESDANMQALRDGDMSRVPELVVTTGVISAVQQAPTGMMIVPHTAGISPGNSGGPLVDRCGRVVGVNTWGREAEGGAERVNYAQKADEVLAFLQRNNVSGITPVAGPCTPQVPAAALPASPPGAPPPAPGATPPPGSAPAPSPPTAPRQ
jgi:hypothetical protein